MNRFLWAMAHVGGGLVLLGFTWAAIVYTVPRAEAGEPCKGQLVRASWYGPESGRKTASGGAFDGSQWLIAHKTLPFGTRLKLTYRGNSIVAPVLDRGPYVAGRTLDLSSAVADALGTKRAGVALVCMELVTH